VLVLQLNVLFTASYQETNVQVLADLPTRYVLKTGQKLKKNQIGVKYTPSSRSRAAQIKVFLLQNKGKSFFSEIFEMHIHAFMHIILQMQYSDLHVTATLVTILRKADYRRRIYRDVTTVCEQMHRCEILNF
jgi:hypothetical protein